MYDESYKDFWLIDMALAQQSAYWDPEQARKKKNTNKQYVVNGPKNEEVFDKKQDAFNFMKESVCEFISSIDWSFLYHQTETGQIQILSRKRWYKGIEWYQINANSAEVMSSEGEHFQWQIKKIPA